MSFASYCCGLHLLTACVDSTHPPAYDETYPHAQSRPYFQMNKPVFYDPQRKRWKRLRRIFDILALAGLVLGSIFIVGLLSMKPLPELFLQAQKRNYRALVDRTPAAVKLRRSAHRRTDLKPGDIPLNSGEGLRAAYYVE